MIVKTIKTMGTPGRGPPSPRNAITIISYFYYYTEPPQRHPLTGGSCMQIVGRPHPTAWDDTITGRLGSRREQEAESAAGQYWEGLERGQTGARVELEREQS